MAKEQNFYFSLNAETKEVAKLDIEGFIEHPPLGSQVDQQLHAIIKFDEVSGKGVLTHFFGRPFKSNLAGQPILFYTEVLDDAGKVVEGEYVTWKEAMVGHNEIVLHLRTLV